jgi:NAD(P)H dehydrogenase (quinone)
MRVLLVYCHPCNDSFTAAVRDAAADGLREDGHELRICDLYGEGFDPVMRASERQSYHEPTVNEQPVAAHLEALRWCEGLIFVYPTWWYGPPAMLKGWLDRVWVPHATFGMPEPGKPIRPVLTHIRLIGAISTLGSPWWWWRLIMGEPGRRMLIRGLRPLVARRCKTFWLALHEMDSASPEKRARFLARVRQRMARISG